MSTALPRVVQWVSGEPLTHFLLLGIGLFGLHRMVAPPAAQPDTVVISQEAEDWLVAGFEARHGRGPTPAERERLIGQHVDEEVLYREGLALGLDRSDPIVRRRVVQRMELLLEDLAEPSEQELQAFFDAHADAYTGPPTFEVEHRYFTGTDARARAETAREALAAGSSAVEFGQPFPHGDVLRARTRAQLEGMLGGSVAQAVADAPAGEWFVARSGMGWHALRVIARSPGTRPQLARVRARVVEDWRRARSGSADSAAIASLRARYRIDREGAR